MYIIYHFFQVGNKNFFILHLTSKTKPAIIILIFMCSSHKIFMLIKKIMIRSFMKKQIFLGTLFFIFLFLITCITTFVVNSNAYFTSSPTDYSFSSHDFTWPLPNYYTISSPFGIRLSPTTGASTYHSGIDIPAPENTNIYSACSGTVSFLDFERCQWLHYKNHK